MSLILLRRLLNIALVLAFGVVMLGAYTRLTDAGLGCPDWPGCYGKLVVPSTQTLYPQIHLETEKAWTEMAHRYLAGSLLSFIFVILAILLFNPKFKGLVRSFYLFAIVGLMVFQAALGMWTVTLKLLPIVVMGHLLGGFLIVSVLTVMRCHFFKAAPLGLSQWRIVLGIGILLTFLQVALGGWVSSNYAGISCVGFPKCSGQWIPVLNLKEAFSGMHTLGVNYQGGVLDIDARMTIQWIHRLGALIVWLFWLVCSLVLWRKIDNTNVHFAIIALQLLLSLQIILGMINIVYFLPLWSAVLHNGVGVLVLSATLVITSMIVGQRAPKYV